jgi:hypothetical protein
LERDIEVYKDFWAGGNKISAISSFKGILSLIFGLTSILFSLPFWFGIGSIFLTSFSIPFSIFGIILARSRLKESQDANARAGLTVSVFGFLLNIAALIVFLIFFR